MKKTLTLFMIAAFALAAFVMYMYWQEESKVTGRGVMVWSESNGV